jgi:hypothetical protein
MRLSSSVARRLLSRLSIAAAAFAAVAAQAQIAEPLPQPNVALALAGEISSIAHQADGALLLVGNFTSINGVPRDGLARLRPDGSLDPVWYPRVRWRNASPTYANRYINALPDGTVLVHGDMSHFGDQPTGGCGVKLSADPNPVADLSWHANAGCVQDGLTFDDQGWFYWSGSDAVYRRRADTGVLDPDWSAPGDFSGPPRIYDGNGGLILRTGSLLRRLVIATRQLDPDWIFLPPSQQSFRGAVDTAGGFVYLAFSSGQVSKLSLATGQSASGWSHMAPHPLSAIVLGGNADIYVGGHKGVSRMSITTGQVLDTWPADGTRKHVLALARRADGAIIAAGNFARLGATPLMGMALLTPMAAQPTAPVLAEANGIAEKLARQPDGGVIVAGTFDRADGVQRQRLLRLEPDGTLDPDWAPRVDGFIYALATDANGDVYVGGSLQSIDGYSALEGLKKIDGRIGAVRLDYTPQTGTNYVSGLVVDQDSRVYLSAQPGDRIVRRLLSDGSLDQGWWGGTSGVSVWAYSLQRVGNDLYAAVREGTAAFRLRRVSMATGFADPNWKPGLLFPTRLVVAGAGDGDLLIGGLFDSIDGVARRNLARVSSTAPLQVRAWNPSPDNEVLGIGTTAGGRVFVSGTFSRIGGELRPGNAELAQGDGSAVAGWNTSMGGGELLLTEDRIYLTSSPRGVVAYRLDTGDTIFTSSFDPTSPRASPRM